MAPKQSKHNRSTKALSGTSGMPVPVPSSPVTTPEMLLSVVECGETPGGNEVANSGETQGDMIVESGETLGSTNVQMSAETQPALRDTTRGETRSGTPSSIKQDDPAPVQFRMDTPSEHDMAIEDDETLELQIRLGQIQERRVKMQIEHKRRKANQTVSSEGAVNLTQELSMEIDRERSTKYTEVVAQNKALQQEISQMKATFQNEQAQHISQIRAEMQAELENVKNDIRTQLNFESEARANADKVRQNEEYQQAILKVQDEAAMRINLMKQEFAAELGIKTRDADEQCERIRHEAQSHISEMQGEMAGYIQLERECAERLTTEHHTNVCAELRTQLHEQNEHMKVNTQRVERLQAESTSAISQKDLEIRLLQGQLATLRDESQREIENLRAEAEKAHNAKMQTMKREFEVEKSRLMSEPIELNMKIQELEGQLDDARVTHFNETEALRRDHKNQMLVIERQNREVKETLETNITLFKRVVKELRDALNSLR